MSPGEVWDAQQPCGPPAAQVLDTAANCMCWDVGTPPTSTKRYAIWCTEVNTRATGL